MRLDLTYDYLVRHIVPGPQSLSYFVTIILLPVALLIPRSILSRWQSIALFTPIMVGCTIHAWTAMGTVDVPSLDVLLWALFLLVFKDPWTEFALLEPSTQSTIDSDKSLTGKEAANAPSKSVNSTTFKQTYPLTLRARLPWTFRLLSNLTLDNWLITHPSHDKKQPRPPASRSRKPFLTHTLLHGALAYLTLDLTSALTTTDPYFTDARVPLSSSLPSRLLRPALISLQAHALISSLFPLPSALPVLLNALHLTPSAWSPHTWPPYFGPPAAFLRYGLRGWWGGYWHQTMRWATSGAGTALADWAGLREGGFARRALALVSAFGLSGGVHLGLVPPEPVGGDCGREGVWRARACVAGFFWVQVLGLLGEDVVRRMLGRVRVGVGMKEDRFGWVRGAVNVIWLCCWFAWCMPLLGEAGRLLGWWRHWLVPVSLYRGLRGKGWVAWAVLRQ